MSTQPPDTEARGRDTRLPFWLQLAAAIVVAVIVLYGLLMLIGWLGFAFPTLSAGPNYEATHAPIASQIP